MFDIDAIKNNWQNQKRKDLPVRNSIESIHDMIAKLSRFEKKQFRINFFKTAGITLLMIYFIWATIVITSVSVIKLISIGWMLISIIIFLIIYWKAQLKINKFNINATSINFINSVLENFSAQKELYTQKFWYFGAAIIIGTNIYYLDVLKSLATELRVGAHLGVSILLLAVFYLGIKFRKFRFRNENQPLIDELEKIKKDLGENND